MQTIAANHAVSSFVVGCALGLAVLCSAGAHAGAPGAGNGSTDAATAAPALPPPLRALVSEALRSNPEIRAAAREQAAALERVGPAGALDDPMLEAGVLNVPVNTLSLSREDMTMKMLGVSQRIPYPGKRELRRQVAQGEADALAHGYRETLHRVGRDVRLAYYELALSAQSQRIVNQSRMLLEQLLKLAEGRYAVAQAGQMDVLRAQSALSKTGEELIKLERERPLVEAELNRLLGRAAGAPAPSPEDIELKPMPLRFSELSEKALSTRPQLLALQRLAARAEHALELARKESLPDFDLRVSYGQRNGMPDGTPRADMLSLTVAINLPVWRQAKTMPKLAEAQAMHEQALSVYDAQRNETLSKLRQQVAVAEQSLRAAALYDQELVPQARLTIEAALAAYRVNRLELAPLLDNRMAILNFELARAAAVASYHKALAEIDFLTGTPPAAAPGVTP